MVRSGRIGQTALPAIEAHGPIEAWIFDDTGFPKKGHHSVGVARQYCGQLGKQDNCQAVVSLSVANHHASLPIAHRLYLPESWANDAERRAKAGVPPDITFRTRPEIALDLLRDARAAGIVPATVLADAVPPPHGRRGGKPSHAARRARQVSANELTLSLPAEAWRNVTWRVMDDPLTSRFARLRVRPATPAEQPRKEWLLIERPEDEPKPTKCWLSTMPADTGFEAMADRGKLRWRIERDYQDLKQELGLGHYEGRGWRGLHHHITLCIAAYGFLIAERAALPPSAS